MQKSFSIALVCIFVFQDSQSSSVRVGMSNWCNKHKLLLTNVTNMTFRNQGTMSKKVK